MIVQLLSRIAQAAIQAKLGSIVISYRTVVVVVSLDQSLHGRGHLLGTNHQNVDVPRRAASFAQKLQVL